MSKFGVQVLNEAGYKEACIGISLSYNTLELDRAEKRSTKLAHQDGGHNKFLESIIVWLDVLAPRYWWQQFDTYRIGVTKQSESTMHTLMQQKNILDSKFEDGTSSHIIAVLRGLIQLKQFDQVKKNLPESFMQRRIICLNYKSLRNIILQRYNHKLLQWQQFCDMVLEQVEHPELLPNIRELRL